MQNTQNLHGDTSVLDLLHTEASKFRRVPSTSTLGKSKWIVSVVSRDFFALVPLTLVSDALEPSSRKKDLKPSSGGDHGNGIEGSRVGNVREGNTRGGGEEPGIGRFRAEGIGARGSKVERKVDAELLNHESNGGDHRNASVLDFSILEPLQGVRVGIFQDPGAEGRALVSGLDANSKSLIECGVQ